jgi:hypothetical protein
MNIRTPVLHGSHILITPAIRTQLHSLLLCILPLSVTSPAIVMAGEREDYLIVENVSHLLIYDKYQQVITDQERATLPQFVPMRIASRNDLLSDGFTPCMKVEINDDVFYLIMDKDRNLIGARTIGFSKTYDHVIPLHDSIRVLTDRSVEFSTPMRTQKHFLGKGEKIIRVFLVKDWTYVQRTGRVPAFGWIALRGQREGRDWSPIKERATAGDLLPERIVREVREKIDGTNALLTRLFTYFNVRTHQNQQIPQWQVSVTDSTMTCVLYNPPPGHNFAESTMYLSRDLENSVLGTELKVFSSPGKIDIRKGDNKSIN